MCMSCNKNKVSNSGKAKQSSARPKSNVASRTMYSGNPFGSPKVRMSFSSRNR